jgi:hypothetical protein
MKTLKMTFVLVVYFGLLQMSYGQPDTLWTKTYGAVAAGELGQSVQQTIDGGYIILGTIFPLYPSGIGKEKVWLLKTNSFGDTLWTRIYIWRQSRVLGKSVQQTTDGGYIILGKGDFNIWLIKTNSSGDTLWTKTYDGRCEGWGTSIQQTTDEGYIITGTVYPDQDVWLLKTDTYGDTLWNKTFGNGTGDSGYSVQQTMDGGYIIAGYTNKYNQGGPDVSLIKTDTTGTMLWNKIYGSGGIEEGYSVQQTTDGGFAILSSAGSGGAWLIKTNSSGDTLWTKTIDGSLIDIAYAFQQTNDGGYIITGGLISSDPNDLDVSIIKTNPKGNILWTKNVGSDGWDMGYSIQQTSDGGYIITGCANSEEQSSVKGDLFLIKLSASPMDIRDSETELVSNYCLYPNYPNPFNPSTTIEFTLPKSEFVELKVFNILGKEVTNLVSKKLNQGNHTYKFDGMNLASGVYYYQLVAGDYREVKKMILLR